MVMTKHALTIVAIGSAVCCGALYAEAKPAQAAKPAVKSETKQHSSTVAQDINTHIAVGDVTTKAPKEVKIVGYVNVPEAMQNSKKGAEIAKSLDVKRQGLTEAIKKEEAKITQAMNDVKTKESSMSPAARSAEEAKVVKMRRDYESLVKASEDELKIAMQQASEELTTEVEKTAIEIAKSKGYDIIVDVYSGRTVYAANDALNTADLIHAMDHKYEVAHKKPASPAAAVAA